MLTFCTRLSAGDVGPPPPALHQAPNKMALTLISGCFVLFLLISGGCIAPVATTAPPKTPLPPTQPDEISSPPGAPSPSTPSVKQDATPDAPAKSTQLSGAELQTWNDPAFQKQYAQSYIAETDIEPRVTVVERKQLQTILELISADKMDEAATQLASQQGEAASAVFDFTLANIYFQQEQLDKAATNYELAVQKYPKFRRAWRNLGLSYIRQNEFAKALPALTRVVELGGGDAITYGLLGFAYASSNNHTAAESAYRNAMLLDAQTLDWKLGLARSFFKQSRFADAVSLCSTLIAQYPDRADLWLLQASAYIGLQQPLNAAENYELIDRLGHSTADSLNTLGDIYTNEEIFDLAVNAYSRAMDKNPQAKPDRAIRAAKVLTARNALPQTQQLIRQIETIYDNRLETEDRKALLKLRARIAVASGASEEEARVLEEIVALDPLDGEALLLLGQHSSRNGRVEKAIFYYERAASLEKFAADAKVRHAQLLVKTGGYEDALRLLRRAQQLKPRDNIQEYLEQVERVAKGRS